MKQGYISVIVPVFNVEKYLDKCICSILNQTYTRLEVILVDDGSSDNSGTICDKWCARDNRVSVLHIENSGAGSARNSGYEISNGEWISFIDSDDYIEEHMYEILLSFADSETDLIECSILKTADDNARFVVECNKSPVKCDSEYAMRCNITENMFLQTPPNKIYRRQVVDNVKFPIGKMIDDDFWTYRVIHNCRKLVHIDAKLYAYRQHEQSVMHRKYCEQRLDVLDAKMGRFQLIQNDYQSISIIAKQDFVNTCIFEGQMVVKYLTGKEQKYAFDKIIKLSRLISLSWKEIFHMNCNFKSKIWIVFSKISLVYTCKLRNYLNIGL